MRRNIRFAIPLYESHNLRKWLPEWPRIDIVVGAGNERVSFFAGSGLIRESMKLKDFLKGC